MLQDSLFCIYLHWIFYLLAQVFKWADSFPTWGSFFKDDLFPQFNIICKPEHHSISIVLGVKLFKIFNNRISSIILDQGNSAMSSLAVIIFFIYFII